MNIVTKIVLVDDQQEKFFGEGPYRLLKGVAETGSLYQAAAQMDMSYSKAMRILKRAEEVIGSPLTDRTIGGLSGGGSRLTETGKRWVDQYEALYKACAEANRKCFAALYPAEQNT